MSDLKAYNVSLDVNTLLTKSLLDYRLSVSIYCQDVSANEDDKDIALFHMQQAVEKCLKALLLHYNMSIPNCGNIGKLLELLQNQINVEIFTIRKHADTISLWKLVTYPTEDLIIDKSIFYEVAFDYVVLYNYTRKLIEES